MWYENAYIRKTTALYLIQENYQVSNDRLLRVRWDQPEHLFSIGETYVGMDTSVRSGDLCVFKRVDRKNPKYLLGRVVQFSYLSGSKRDRQYTSTYVVMTKESCNTIGAFANWYIGVYSDSSHVIQVLPFIPFENFFSTGYLPMDQYVNTISDECLVSVIDVSFGIPYVEITKIIPNWFKELTLENKSHWNMIYVWIHIHSLSPTANLGYIISFHSHFYSHVLLGFRIGTHEDHIELFSSHKMIICETYSPKY